MLKCCKKICKRRKSARAQIVCVTLPFLLVGLVLIYLLCVLYGYFIIRKNMDSAANHLVEIRQEDLLRRSEMQALRSQKIVQEPIHNNYIFSSFFKEVINSNLKLSQNFEISTYASNYNDFVSEKKNRDLSQWYITPGITDESQLNSTQKDNISTILSLFPLFKGILFDSFDEEGGLYNTIYYATNDERTFVQYPGYKSDMLINWPGTDTLCPEHFDPPQMEFYDARCRPFYKKAVDEAFDFITHGPYTNPSSTNMFYALTMSQAIPKSDGQGIHGVLNHDLNLILKGNNQFEGEQDSDRTHSMITSVDGTLIEHSNVTLSSTSDSITKAEFSQTSVPLENELYTEETKKFNETFLPIFKSIQDPIVTTFTKFGNEYLAAVNPIRVRHNVNEEGIVKFDRMFIYIQIRDREAFIRDITDKSDLLKLLIIFGCVFTVTMIFLILASAWFLLKIASRGLLPIKILNSKVSILMTTNGEFNMDQMKSKMTSSEARKMFRVFSQLITARRFTSNKIMYSSNAIAIMEYAEAYTVFRGNQKVQGICMNNIGHTYYKLGDYEKAAKSYHEASECARSLMSNKLLSDVIMKENIMLYCKRKYYFCMCKFYSLQNHHISPGEKEILRIEKELEQTKTLIEKLVKNSVSDILIMLNLYSSKCLLMTRRLISAERDLHIAIKIFKKKQKLIQEDRPDIPIIPRCILRQRILLQKSLVMLDFKKKRKAAYLLTDLLKIGEVYDPAVRKEALMTLHSLFGNHPEAQNIEQMLQLFQPTRKKNIILLVDSLKDKYFETKKNLCQEIFDCLEQEDNISLISMENKVNRVFSLVPKSQNTIQLSNQLKYLDSKTPKSLLLVDGLGHSLDEIVTYSIENRNNNYNWIICIISSIDTSSFRSRDELILLEEELENKNINILCVVIGDADSEKYKKLHTYMNFNDSTIFLNIQNEYNKRDKNLSGMIQAPLPGRRSSGARSEILKLRALIKNTSNIQIIEENLVYEEFK
ncbi:unnamed protein product [Moneuplotes crassus]|uniref:VWFA domain-containing protein n=1 Tax=Euplotes crassus TaxID=5936 RepID=A0AAD2D5D7_EUPCR|nr:unnamed protein product [Moneuplotes crassus]